MPDRYKTFSQSLTSPVIDGFAVTPSDGVDLPEQTRALYIGGGGAVSCVLAGGATLTFAGLLAGTVLPVRVRRVRATGTTATSILGLV
jgi:hypothetical protein